MSKINLSKLVDLDNRSINPRNFAEVVFEVYSLPSYDHNKRPEKTLGSNIKSINCTVSPNSILFNKLNVRFKRIWNLHHVKENSICSGEFLRLLPKGCDQNYLYYFLQSDFLTSYLIGASGGSSGSHSRISPHDLMKLKVSFPDLPTQQKISSHLSNIDFKIELNNKINAELEAMAKLVYDHWFVQFDFPDANGKPYKSSGGKMTMSTELKWEIPKGWELISLSSLIEESKNGDWGNESMTDGFTKCFCIRGADINGLNGLEIFDPPVRYIDKSHNNRQLKADDLIIEISGGSPTQSTGRMAYISSDVLLRLDSKVVCSNFCKAITLKQVKLSYVVRRHWARLYDTGIFFNHEGKTSGIKNLLFDQLAKDIKIAIPHDDNLVNTYFEFEESIDKQKQNNLRQNEELIILRDWLLPMLMNGQVKIIN